MNQFIDAFRSMQCDYDAQITDFRKKSDYATQVVRDVYQKRTEAIESLGKEITSLMAAGDFDAANLKLAKLNELESSSAEDEIRARLAEYNLRDVTNQAVV